MKKAALIGNPVSHSISPALFRFWFEEYGIDAEYNAYQLSEAELHPFLSALRKKNYVGANVTIPYKEKIFREMDVLDETAKITGAVNAITVDQGGTLGGQNTDCLGFIENLKEAVPDFDLKNQTILVLGNGGAARAVIFALLGKNVKQVRVAGRSRKNLSNLKAHFSDERILTLPWDRFSSAMKDIDLLVNTTPLGMKGYPPLLLSEAHFPTKAIVYDLIYNPLRTPLLKQAEGRSLKTLGGLGMLLHQAVPAFEAWFGKKPIVSDMLRTYMEKKIQKEGS